jgi:dihydroflavonol-4-reductase
VGRRSASKALVIGASGHIGNAIVRALLDRKCEVTACGRRKVLPANLSGLPIRYASGDTETAGQFDRWIAGHDLVVDAAAPYPLDVFSPFAGGGADSIAYVERRTRRLLTAISRRRARLVYVGSFVTQVQPQSNAHRFEHQLMRLAHPYFEVKRLIESQVLDASRRGVPIVIANPTYCLGPWDLHDRRLCTIPLLLRGEIPGSITQLLNVIDVRDVAEGVLAALDKELYGKPLQMSGHNILTNDMYSLICEIGGAPPPRLSTAPTLAIAGAYLAELMWGALDEQTPLPAGGMMMATLFDYMSPSEQLQELGITPRPLSETITDAIEWYRQIGDC